MATVSTTNKRPPLNTGRKPASNAPKAQKGKLIMMNGQIISTFDNHELSSRLEEVLERNKHLDNKLNTKTRTFKDALIYCQKTIENQDFQIERLNEEFKKLDEHYEEKLRNERQRFENEMTGNRLTIERLNTENILMKAQLGNLDQLELELKEAQKDVQRVQRELEEKNKLIEDRELKQRELIIMTTEKVRKEMKLELVQEIDNIKKELQIQSRAILEANEHVVKKIKLKLKQVEIERDHNKTEMRRLVGELESKEHECAVIEKEKAQLSTNLSKMNNQSSQKLFEANQQLEKTKETLCQIKDEHGREVVKLSNQLDELNERFAQEQKQLSICQARLCKETNTHEIVSKKLRNQNQKLLALREFFETIFEKNNDNYIDLMLGENRTAVFAKLSMLLQSIPILTE